MDKNLADEPSEGKIRVMVVDDHPVVRLGLAAIVNAQPDMTVVAEAGSGEAAVQWFHQRQPDLVLMDLRLPAMSGAEAIRLIRNESKRTRFIALTTYDGDEDIVTALEAGAQAYLLKGISQGELVNAIRKVHAGHKYLPDHVSKVLAERPPCFRLRTRELEVLQLIVKGLSNKEIAKTLGITEGTVKWHVNIILGLLNVNDRTQAAVAALQRGIVHF